MRAFCSVLLLLSLARADGAEAQDLGRLGRLLREGRYLDVAERAEHALRSAPDDVPHLLLVEQAREIYGARLEAIVAEFERDLQP